MKIITHSGAFHADDVFAVALLKLINSDAEVIRTRDPETIASGDYVVDVGLVYDESINRFDHHQKGGAGVRDNGIPYASFGLTWKKFGADFCKSESVARFVDDTLVSYIDAGDNGVETYKPIYDGVSPYDISNVISSFIPSDESKPIDESFLEAVLFAKGIIEREVKSSRIESEDKKKILEIARKSSFSDVVVLPRFMRGKEVLVDFPGVLYVVFPGRVAWGDTNWYVKAVQKSQVGFEVKKPLPSEWAGKTDRDLQDVSLVKDAVFCHRGRFLASAKSKEGALELANKALDA